MRHTARWWNCIELLDLTTGAARVTPRCRGPPIARARSSTIARDIERPGSALRLDQHDGPSDGLALGHRRYRRRDVGEVDDPTDDGAHLAPDNELDDLAH